METALIIIYFTVFGAGLTLLTIFDGWSPMGYDKKNGFGSNLTFMILWPIWFCVLAVVIPIEVYRSNRQ